MRVLFIIPSVRFTLARQAVELQLTLYVLVSVSSVVLLSAMCFRIVNFLKRTIMDKEELKKLVLDEWKKGNIVFKTIEGLHKQKVEDFVRQPIEGQLYDIRDMATCLAFIDEPFGVNNFSSMVLLRYYYDKCNKLEQMLEKYEAEQGHQER